jgi:hypothetical protein
MTNKHDAKKELQKDEKEDENNKDNEIVAEATTSKDDKKGETQDKEKAEIVKDVKEGSDDELEKKDNSKAAPNSNKKKRKGKNDDITNNEKKEINDPNKPFDLNKNATAIPVEASYTEVFRELSKWQCNVQTIASRRAPTTVLNFDPPYEIFRDISEMPLDFHIKEIAHDGEIYVHLKQKYNLSYKNFIEMIKELVLVENIIFDDSKVFMREPDTTVWEDVTVPDPISLGIPFEDLAVLGERAHLFRIALSRLLKKHNMDDFKKLDIRAMVNPLNARIYQEIDEYLMGAKDRILNFIKKFLLYRNQRNFDDENKTKFKPMDTPKKFTFPVEYDWDISEFLNDCPGEFFTRLCIISEISTPNVVLRGVAAGAIAQSIQLMTNKMNEINQLLTISYSSDRDEEIRSYMQALMCYGWCTLDIDFEDSSSTSTSSLTNFLMALILKMMLNYDPLNFGSMITEDTAKKIESYIMKYIQTTGGLEYVDYRNEWPMEISEQTLESTIPYRVTNRERSTRIDTIRALGTFTGHYKWMNSGTANTVNAEEDLASSLYPKAARRTRIGPFKLEYTERGFEDAKVGLRSSWDVYTRIMLLIDNLRYDNKSLRFNIRAFLNYIADRLIIFFHYFNHYASRNYYNGFRPMQESIARMYAKGENFMDFPEATVRAKTLVFLAMAINDQSPFVSTVPDFDKIKAEMAINRDLQELSANFSSINKWVPRFNFNNEIGTTKKRKMAVETLRDGYLRRYLDEFIQAREIATLPMTMFVYHSSTYVELNIHTKNLRTRCRELIRDMIYDNINLVGIMDHFMYTRVPKFPILSEIENMAEDRRLWTNSIALEMNNDEKNTKGLTLREICVMMKERKLKGMIKRVETGDEVIKIDIPIPFELNFTEAFISEDFPIRINWVNNATLDIKYTEDIEVSKRSYIYASVERLFMYYWDDYVDKYSSGGRVLLPDPQDVFWTFNKWAPSSTLCKVFCLRKSVEVFQLFDTIELG